MSSASLTNLPVELIYHLFEYLDLSTILFSFRFVSKRFHHVVNEYDRYQIDLRRISKGEFDRLCFSVRPETIRSLILSNDCSTPHQIQTFLSRFSFDRLTKIRSLKLIKIEENQLFPVLMHLNSPQLHSLSIEASSWVTFGYTIRVLLSSTIAKSHLEHLDLNISYRDLDMLSWPPLPTTLKCLRLERCTFQEFCMILRHATNLNDFVLGECVMYNTDGTMYQPLQTISSVSITSFHFGPCFRRMKELLIILNFLPKLTHLKLILWTDFSDSVIDGTQWEHFITRNLLYLKRFEFFFDDLTFLEGRTFNFEIYLKSFRSKFWIDEKKWFVMCDFIQSVSIVRLYSLPICNASLAFFLYSQKTSVSTLPVDTPQRFWTDQVREMNIRLYETTDFDIFKALKSPDAKFRRIHRLSLSLDGRFASNISAFLPTMIDFSILTRLSLQLLANSVEQNHSLIENLAAILRQTTNIDSLKISSTPFGEPLMSIERYCALIPPSVKHLQISIQNFDEIKILLDELPNLFSVTFYSTQISSYVDELKKWIETRRKSSLFRDGLRCVQIWLGTPLLNIEQEKTSIKRVFSRFRHKNSH
jgi:hypothetical protein